jgi:hypothetical protein
MKKRIVALFLAVVFLYASSSAFALNNNYGEVTFELNLEANPPAKLNGKPYGTSYYEQLTDLEKAIYNARLENLEVFKNAAVDEVYFEMPENAKADEVIAAFFNACYAFDFDHPEVFWLSKVMRLSYYTNSSGVVTKALFKKPDTGWYNTAFSSKEQIEKAEADFNAVVDQLVSQAQDTVYDKVLFFHDWLVNNNEYNRLVYEGNIEDASQLAWCAASALIGDPDDPKDDPVCEGYARAFKVLCDNAGVECAIISGISGGAHMWNAVKLPNGFWFALDATFDDPIAATPVLSHKYFLKGSETMSKTHTAQGSVTSYGTFIYPTLNKKDYPMLAGGSLGDVNLDGKINTGDAVAVLLYIVGKSNLTDKAKACADYNCDSTVNTGDAVFILQYVAG